MYSYFFVVNILVCSGHDFITKFSPFIQVVFPSCFLCCSNEDICLFQTDYTRHLEEIAKRTENVLLEAVQNCFVSGKTYYALEYLNMWENFLQLARQGKFIAIILHLHYTQTFDNLVNVSMS